MRVGVFHWKRDDGFGKAVMETLHAMGHEEVSIFPGMEHEVSGLEVLLLYMPWGSLDRVFRALRGTPKPLRPVTVLWQGEQFPDPRLPQAVWLTVGVVRSYVESLAHEPGLWQAPGVRRVLSWLTARLHRFRYIGDIWRFGREGLIDVLAVMSPWVANELRRRGIGAITVGMGYYPDCGKDLAATRDIDVLWLGKEASGRRRRLLARVHGDLARRGIELMVIDGVERAYVFGSERTAILNRTKIMLNLLRQEWDDNSMRFFFASANGALIVSEPVLEHSPFVAGVHIVEAPVSKLADAVIQYLGDEDQRKSIVERARALAVNTLTLEASLQQLLGAAEEASERRGAEAERPRHPKHSVRGARGNCRTAGPTGVVQAGEGPVAVGGRAVDKASGGDPAKSGART